MWKVPVPGTTGSSGTTIRLYLYGNNDLDNRHNTGPIHARHSSLSITILSYIRSRYTLLFEFPMLSRASAVVARRHSHSSTTVGGGNGGLFLQRVFQRTDGGIESTVLATATATTMTSKTMMIRALSTSAPATSTAAAKDLAGYVTLGFYK